MSEPSTGADQAATTPAASEPLALVKHLRGEGLSAIDAARHERLGLVGEGRQPHAFAVQPGGRWAYVPYMGSNLLEVIDLRSLTVRRRLERVGTAPVGATLTGNGEYLLVSCYGELPDQDTPGLIVFDGAASGRLEPIAQLPIGKAAGITVDARNDVWVALNDDDAVVRLDGVPPFSQRDRYDVPADPQDITYAPSEGLLGVNNVEDDCVTFIDARKGEILGSVPAPNPRGGTVVPSCGRWFVGNTDGDGVTAIDLRSVQNESVDGIETAPTRVALGTPTAFTDVTPDGALLVIDAYEDDRVTFLDPVALDVVARVRTGQAPHHPRFSADGHVCYVPNMDADTVTVLDVSGIREGDGDVDRITTIEFPEGAGPSGCFRTDRGTQL